MAADDDLSVEERSPQRAMNDERRVPNRVPNCAIVTLIPPHSGGLKRL